MGSGRSRAGGASPDKKSLHAQPTAIALSMRFARKLSERTKRELFNSYT